MEKRQKKKRIKNWGRRVCALQWWWFYRNDRGKKVKDETIERFYPISDLLSILGHCERQHNRSERLSWTVTADCRTSASIFKTIILPLLLDWKAWSDFPTALVTQPVCQGQKAERKVTGTILWLDQWCWSLSKIKHQNFRHQLQATDCNFHISNDKRNMPYIWKKKKKSQTHTKNTHQNTPKNTPKKPHKVSFCFYFCEIRSNISSLFLGNSIVFIFKISLCFPDKQGTKWHQSICKLQQPTDLWKKRLIIRNLFFSSQCNNFLWWQHGN